MKKALFILMMLMILGIVFSYAQCGKKQTITASKTEYFDMSGNLQRSVDENTTVEYDKSSIIITISNPTNGGSKVMSGSVQSDSCTWKTPYKEGKSIIKAAVSDPNGQTRNLIITIEAKEGKLNFLAEAADSPDRRIRLVVDKFEETK